MPGWLPVCAACCRRDCPQTRGARSLLSAPSRPACREVKNSWSTHWGDGGYFRVLRDAHACGAASDVYYAVADAAGAAE